jgi:hypothetical protein
LIDLVKLKPDAHLKLRRERVVFRTRRLFVDRPLTTDDMIIIRRLAPVPICCANNRPYSQA